MSASELIIILVFASVGGFLGNIFFNLMERFFYFVIRKLEKRQDKQRAEMKEKIRGMFDDTP